MMPTYTLHMVYSECSLMFPYVHILYNDCSHRYTYCTMTAPLGIQAVYCGCTLRYTCSTMPAPLDTHAVPWLFPLGWEVLPYLGMVGTLHGDDAHFWDVRFNWFPILNLNSIWLMPSLWRKNCCFLYHLVPKILGPKSDLMFNWNVWFNSF